MEVRFLSVTWLAFALPCLAACELFFPDNSGNASGAGAEAGSPVPCADAQAILCEDFEEGAIDPNRWMVNHQGGSSVVDSTRPHRGRYSLHSLSDPVDSGMPTVSETITNGTTFPPDFYARAFVYFPSMPQPTSRELFFSVQENSNNPPGMTLVLLNNYMTLVDYAASPALVADAPMPFPTNTWACVEWGVHSSTGSTAGSTQVWVDEQSAIPSGSTIVPAIGRLVLGTGFFPAMTPQPSFECWTDDLYVDSQPVGCQK